MWQQDPNENVIVPTNMWDFFSNMFSGPLSRFVDAAGDFFPIFFFWLQVFALFASFFLVLGIIYSIVRINHIRAKEKERYESAVVMTFANVPAKPAPVRNERWEHVLKLAESESETDWRLAIIEADIILNDLVSRMQYPGETLGEKLKGVERSDFLTIDNAWEAHKVRNEIAHSGSGFVLSKRLVDKTINNYKLVFEEFHFI
jgi:hypothetical protein